MIYTISEITATAVDSIVLVAFLAYSLSFKNSCLIKNMFSSALFAILFFFDTTWINTHSTLEGIFTLSYFLILFVYCKISLNGKWWYQLLLVIVELAGIFLVNAVIMIISSSLLKQDYSEILLMRNPARIFLLFISKISFIGFLLPVAIGIRKQKIIVHIVQAIISIISLVATITAGIIIEEMILDDIISIQYASIIMICLSVIDVLLLFIFIQFSAHNKSALKQVALQTRLHDDEIKIKEAVQWNKSVRKLQHDMNNHMYLIAKYIEKGQSDKALVYVRKITDNLIECPIYTDTNNQTLNAMIDLKRAVCKHEDISIKCYIQDDIPEFDDVAFCTIFGNLIDNAIEAERKEEHKEIRLSIELFGTYLKISIQNSISSPVLINGQIPKTSKSDKQNHGLGIQSVIDTVNQNNGAIDFYEQDGWLIADVLMAI